MSDSVKQQPEISLASEGLYSQACNFASFLQKGVDPRTGQYTCSVQLYEAPAQIRNCPVFKLGLVFSPLSPGRSEFGKGWSLNLPHCDPRAKTVLTSTGDSFRISDSGNTLKDLKLQSFQFERDGNEFRFRYKTGQVEILSNKTGDRIFERAELQKLYSPTGRTLEFQWESTNADRRLSQITEGDQVLVAFNYDSKIETVITTAPDTLDARTYTLDVLGGYLGQLRLPGPDELCWNFQYNYHGQLWCIDRVVSPSGLLEIVEYREGDQAHKLPPGQDRPYANIPNVAKHRLLPYQNQPEMVMRYEYSDYNFLGYGSGQDWTQQGDNLYLLTSSYDYKTTLTFGEKKEMQTEYTYNKYHLETRSVKKQGKKSVTQEITYHAKPSGYFAEQEPYYLLPKEVQTTYNDDDTGESPPEITSYEYDNAGNPIKEIQPDGQIIERTYYSLGPEKDCPADPWGFIRYLKEEVVTPAPSEHKTPIRRRNYTYLSLPTVENSLSNHFVSVQEECSFEEGAKELTRTIYDYVSDPASPNLGRLSQQVDKIFGTNAITHSWDYKWESSANQFTKGVKSTTFDNRTIGYESTFSLSTGLEKTHTNRSGVVNSLSYDSLGRLTAATAAVGTKYETTRSQAYSRLPDEVGYCLALTDACGVQTRYYTDGMERVIRSEKQESSTSQTFRVVQERSYNEYGQCVEAVEVDWFYGTGSPTEQRSVIQLEYDGWGQMCRQSISDGKGGSDKAISTVMDPITLTKTEGIVGEGQIRTVLNKMGLIIQKSLLTKEGKEESSAKYEYDGFGRQVSETDHFGRTTHYEMDSFDRIITTTWPDNRVVHTKYSDHSVSILPTSIKLGSHELGKQSFDGLDRMTSSTVGSRVLTNNFNENIHTEPNQITLPSGNAFTLKYVPELNYAATTVNDIDQIEFDKRTGAPVRLENGHSTQELEYYDTGLVSHENWTLKDDDTSWSADYIYSFSGKLQSYKDVHQQKHDTNYNTFGQPQQLTQGPMQVEYTYDEAQRLSEINTQSASDKSALTSQLIYDDFGRVQKRTVLHKSSTLRSIVHTYGPTGLLKKRSLENESRSVMREETFEYDMHNRLVEYTCAGSEPPVDEYGNPLKSQVFEFDSFDNLKKVTTVFQDNFDNIASYAFASDDPTQLIQITNTHSDYPARTDLKYDDNGSLTQDEKGQTLGYDDLNRLSVVRDSSGALLCEYRYDALGRLVCQKVPDQADIHLFYRGSTLVAIQTGERKISLVASDPGFYWGQIVQNEGTSTTQTWVSDDHRSVLTWMEASEVYHTQYTPYGFSPRSDSPSLGFNGQWRDPITGWYHLGNGYRVYNPILMRFHTPDPTSPFASGEVNAYAYCLGDPINRVDPSGHFSLFGIEISWKDVVLTVAAIAATAVAAVLTGGATLAIQVGVSVAFGVVTEFATSVTYDQIAGNETDWASLGIDLAVTAVTGVLPGLGDVAFRGSKAAVKGAAQASVKAAAKGAVKKSLPKKIMGAAKNKIKQKAKELPKDILNATGNWGIDQAYVSPIKDALGVGSADEVGPSQSLNQDFEASDSASLVKQSSFVSRDSIRPALKETQSSLGGFAVYPSSGAYLNTGQSVAQLLNRELRAFYGQGDGPIHGLGAQHCIRNMEDAIRETLRRPHYPADWASVPGLADS
ncbi:RHS repeat protein [Penicillium pulvis]|uniref:RHS repeat protein n=1 Tax=Penicillium pulvis TaxID=1562058 RepID=UPI00254668CE|nr:RHS repeat protein [Penicillium pulvis]KAJ5806343.1 RHS repeat protein [Penicillium pulvis]